MCIANGSGYIGRVDAVRVFHVIMFRTRTKENVIRAGNKNDDCLLHTGCSSLHCPQVVPRASLLVALFSTFNAALRAHVETVRLNELRAYFRFVRNKQLIARAK